MLVVSLKEISALGEPGWRLPGAGTLLLLFTASPAEAAAVTMPTPAEVLTAWAIRVGLSLLVGFLVPLGLLWAIRRRGRLQEALVAEADDRELAGRHVEARLRSRERLTAGERGYLAGTAVRNGLVIFGLLHFAAAALQGF